MDPRTSAPQIPLHLTALAILSPANAPLYVRSFTGEQDELRHYHLAHAAVDVIEERIVMASTPTKPADSYLGLLFCMEDMAFYGFQTASKIRMVLSVALVDAMIKDADIVAIFRAVHHLLLQAIHNPFLSLPPSFHAKHAVSSNTETEHQQRGQNVLGGKMFGTDPDDIRPEWLKGSGAFERGISKIGGMLNGGR
ncbi:Sedlin, N-terminal conserved region-domain-containing protein [Dioszegia hungarica]|uniref:Trafficking protein particle complex subunit 2-like protein n=1 Tax=Dioszegia hungarica TaxID=4972 RepID=A0AA38HEG5_9TREE|nr:Sedlin, N-terminal conserved region-domain-containing protein [Dioszegia hungarica]KAI9638602.1 Sedlin, N-terminal conserved region-domain-containing protein [Dioszegia hungarica]